MNYSINTNVILGSKIALAMAMATGSPVRSHFSNPAEKKRLLDARKAKRRESIKKRSRQLMEELKMHDAALAADSHRMKTAPTPEKPELVALVVDKMVAQQVTFHARLESMLDEMIKLMPIGHARQVKESGAFHPDGVGVKPLGDLCAASVKTCQSMNSGTLKADGSCGI